MKRSIQLLSTLYCITPLILAAHIVEHSKITDIEKYINLKKYPHTIVFFDLDNTLIKLPTTIGNDGFQPIFHSYLQNSLKMSSENAAQNQDSVLITFLYSSPYLLIEDCSKKILNKLKNHGVYTYGLTARCLPGMPCTIEKLSELKLKFNPHAHIPVKLCLNIQSSAYYHSGTLFSCTNNKGDALIFFLKLFNIQPDCIIFIDDKAKNVKDVEAAAQKEDIHCIGIRYTRQDKEINTYNIDTMLAELKQFYISHPEVTPIPGLEP